MAVKAFEQARLKHKWANQHIDKLNIAWTNFLKTDFCHLRVESDGDAGDILRIVSINPLPSEFVLILGDAIHNMRAALDYSVAEILGWKDTRITFPMGEAREELVSSFRTHSVNVEGRTQKRGRNAVIETAVPGFGIFIVNEIRPYKAGNCSLWPLGKLDGRDKHRLLLPIVVPQAILDIHAVDKNTNRLIGVTARTIDGETAALLHTGSGGLKIQSYGKATADVLFNEIGIVEKKHVFSTLVQMSQAVIETIDRLEEFVVAAGWQPPSMMK